VEKFSHLFVYIITKAKEKNIAMKTIIISGNINTSILYGNPAGLIYNLAGASETIYLINNLTSSD